MRHRVSGTKFNVDKDHRGMLIRNLLTSYVMHGQIETTEAKAKALKQSFDKMVTMAKKNTLASSRTVRNMLTNDDAMNKFVSEVLPKLQKRTSGYSSTEVIHEERAGDSARMMRIKMLTE
jgi:large subunit ribosomal protein L17